MKIIVMFLFSVFMVNATYAEYRAFQLEISNTKTKQKRTIASQLDPDQYRGYFPIAKEETIKYTATWMCYGDTSYTDKICLNPYPNIRPEIKPTNTNNADTGPSLNKP